MKRQSPWSLTDRRVIVTGASSGIGAAVAIALGAAGARPVLVGRNGTRLNETRARIDGEGGIDRCLTVAVDVTTADAPSEIVDRAVQWLGGIDAIVHCAGIFRLSPVQTAGLDELDLLYATNVRAPYALSQAALPHIARGGSIILVGSNLTRVAKHGMAAYSASKAAVEALGRSLAIELGPMGIRINTIAPGIVRTPMVDVVSNDPDLTAREIDATALGRLGDPEDVAHAVLYLASDAARHLTGATLVVDAGESVR